MVGINNNATDNNNYYYHPFSIVPNPMTLSIWVKTANDIQAQLIFSLIDAGYSTNAIYELQIRGDAAGHPVRFMVSPTDFADTTTGFIKDKWHHLCAVELGTTRYVYIDGGSKGTKVATKSYTIAHIGVGARPNGALPIKGSFANATIWTKALTDSEILSLAQGIHPYKIHPESIAFHTPMEEESIQIGIRDMVGGLFLTKGGVSTPTIVDSPKLINIKPIYSSWY